ncbi:MAG: bacillithiol system redox-active protein YtxJ [Pedobacter sp.]|nr:MAG: bacillithiol system redox-active protein YtxJ [Pedobacter sp.]
MSKQWINITTPEQLSVIKQAQSYNLIFKHSTRCSISSMAKRSFEQEWDILPEDINLYFLDLISYRQISSDIAEMFQVHHESPQLLLIKDGQCILDSSHGDISAEEVVEVFKG